MRADRNSALNSRLHTTRTYFLGEKCSNAGKILALTSVRNGIRLQVLIHIFSFLSILTVNSSRDQFVFKMQFIKKINCHRIKKSQK